MIPSSGQSHFSPWLFFSCRPAVLPISPIWSYFNLILLQIQRLLFRQTRPPIPHSLQLFNWYFHATFQTFQSCFYCSHQLFFLLLPLVRVRWESEAKSIPVKQTLYLGRTVHEQHSYIVQRIITTATKQFALKGFPTIERLKVTTLLLIYHFSQLWQQYYSSVTSKKSIVQGDTIYTLAEPGSKSIHVHLLSSLPNVKIDWSRFAVLSFWTHIATLLQLRWLFISLATTHCM